MSASPKPESASPTPDWRPFVVLPDGARSPGARRLGGPDGVGDRLRIAAFAELQARQAFAWGARSFPDAPEELRAVWTELAAQEDKHLGWLLARMEVLGVAPGGRPVSDHLFRGLLDCTTAHAFAWTMAKAEERGRVAGEAFAAALHGIDPTSASLFGQIAAEEADHIELALRFFPESDRGRP